MSSGTPQLAAALDSACAAAGAAAAHATVQVGAAQQAMAAAVARAERANQAAADAVDAFTDVSEAQQVLDAYHSGEATVVRVEKNGNIVVDDDEVTGHNNNVRAGYRDQPTHRFIIKGTKSVSVVPTTPGT